MSKDHDPSTTNSTPEPKRDFVAGFGVGCFHFAPVEPQTGEFDSTNFVKELIANLEKITNITGINVKGFRAFRFLGIEVLKNIPSIRFGPYVFPNPLNSKISFELFIPTRIQEELLSPKIRTLTADRFNVSIYYDNYMPVSIVEPIEDVPIFSSESVVVVRKYLERVFSESKDFTICFQFLGPSPFHADFFIFREIKDSKDTGPREKYVECEVKRFPGYDDINIIAKNFRSDEAEKIKETSFRCIVQEIGFYYRIVQFRNKIWRRRSKIASSIRSLRNMHVEKSSTLRAFLNIFKFKKTINSAFFQIYDLELDLLGIPNMLESRQKEILDLGLVEYLKEYAERELPNPSSQGIEQALRVLKVLEARQASFLQNSIVFLAAVGGAIVGAAFTFMVGK